MRTFIKWMFPTIAAVAVSFAASAATRTDTFTVSATVADACTALTASDINFGTFSGTDKAVGGQISVTCSSGTPYQIGLDNGANASEFERRMISGPNFIEYDLFQDMNHTTHWGNTQGEDTVGGTGNGSSQAIPVHALTLTSNSPKPGGTYTDTVTATLYY